MQEKSVFPLLCAPLNRWGNSKVKPKGSKLVAGIICSIQRHHGKNRRGGLEKKKRMKKRNRENGEKTLGVNEKEDEEQKLKEEEVG